MTARLAVDLDVAVGVPQALALLADPEFIRWRGQFTPGLSERLISHCLDRSTLVIRNRSVLPAAWLPAVVQSALISSPVRIDRVETWDLDKAAGTQSVQLHLAPGRAWGDAALTPTGPRTSTLSYTITVVADVPILAGAIERSVTGHLGPALQHQAQALSAYRTP